MWKVEGSNRIQKLSTFHYLLSALRIMAGGTEIEPYPFQEKCNVFKRFLQEKISVLTPNL
jgi:hypothetical protein